MSEDIRARLTALEEAERAGMPASTVNGCPCDFCTGVKKWADNWCARCAKITLPPPKHWENMDVCDECDEQLRAELTTLPVRAEE